MAHASGAPASPKSRPRVPAPITARGRHDSRRSARPDSPTKPAHWLAPAIVRAPLSRMPRRLLAEPRRLSSHAPVVLAVLPSEHRSTAAPCHTAVDLPSSGSSGAKCSLSPFLYCGALFIRSSTCRNHPRASPTTTSSVVCRNDDRHW
jgi:hypothetical protein